MAGQLQPKAAELETRTFATRRHWRAWLARHHEKSPGLWLKFAKKGSGVPSVVYAEALEEALCFGWIDGQLKSIDATYYAQRFTPRRPRSKWSKINCAKAAELIAQGRMEPAGLRQMEAAKADGRWDAAYDSPRNATVPDDFAKALARNARARKFFATLNAANRYAVLYRIHDAKRPATRQKRIAALVEMLAAGKTFHPSS
jgi:uncharacterized protein YdeI (YjbR/CyaY-like superfamily)